MTKEQLIERITKKHNVFGDINLCLRIKEYSDSSNKKGGYDLVTKLTLDENEQGVNELGLMNAMGTWFYPLNVLTKRELESVCSAIVKSK